MAQTYTLSAAGVTLAANKVILGAFNGTGSGRILRIYRVWALNNQVTAVAGVVNTIELRRITTGSGGVAITPLKHDSTNESFPAQIVVSTNMSATQTDLMARAFWSSDEPAAGAITNDELQTMPAMNLIWDVSYNDSNIEPMVCREGFGLALVNITSTVGIADVFFEVTLASV
jgi:hypothetical protein